MRPLLSDWSTMPPPDDLRRHPRAPLRLRIGYERMNAFFADYTKNISKGGTFIKTVRPPEVGTRCRFSLSLPALPEPLLLDGEVAWVLAPGDAQQREAEPGMGVRCGLARSDLDHVPRGLAHSARGIRPRSGMGHDAHHGPRLVEEDHVEGDGGVVHPEGVLLAGGEDEEHPVVRVERAAEHQAPRPGSVVAGDLHLHHPGAARGLEAHGPAGQGGGPRRLLRSLPVTSRHAEQAGDDVAHARQVTSA